MLLMLFQPVSDPGFLARHSPRCVAEKVLEGQWWVLWLPAGNSSCPWNPAHLDQHVLAEWSTRYNHRNQSRRTNLEAAAQVIDGRILQPGEVFRFNEVVGERTEDRGFEIAGIIASGAYQKGVGGGICQTSSTLHAAALLAGLEILERRPHQFRVKYIPPGLDATVDYGTKDLVIRNPYPFPILMEMGTTGPGFLVARIKGPGVRYHIRYQYEIVEETPSDVVHFVVEPGNSDRVKYYGRPGYTVDRFLSVGDIATGHRFKRRLRQDIYLPSPWTLRVAKAPSRGMVRTNVSPRKIESLLQGSPYRPDMARFTDVDQYSGEYVPPPRLNQKLQASYQRFKAGSEKAYEAADTTSPPLTTCQTGLSPN
jgi:hypothetical protein